MIAALMLGWLTVAAPLEARPDARSDARSDARPDTRRGAKVDARVDSDAGFTLAQAIAAMRAGNPLLDVATANVDMARASSAAARLWENPVLGGDYFLGIRDTSYDRVGTFVVGVGQWLPVTGTMKTRGEMAAHEARAVALDGQRMIRELELRVEAGMLGLAAALRELEIREAALADLREHGRIVHARVSAGVTPVYDDTRMALALADAEALVRAAEAAVTRARGEFDVAVGPRAEALRGKPRLDLLGQLPLPALDELRVKMLERPDLAAAQARVQSALSGVKLARREVFPGIGLRVAAGFGQGPGQVDVGMGLSIPLPILNRGQGFIARARAGVRAAQNTAEALVVASEQRLAAAYRTAQQQRDASRYYSEMSTDAADALLSQAGSGYRDGRLSVLELTDASLSVRDMRLRDLELAMQARFADLHLRRVVEVGFE